MNGMRCFAETIDFKGYYPKTFAVYVFQVNEPNILYCSKLADFCCFCLRLSTEPAPKKAPKVNSPSAPEGSGMEVELEEKVMKPPPWGPSLLAGTKASMNAPV